MSSSEINKIFTYSQSRIHHLTGFCITALSWFVSSGNRVVHRFAKVMGSNPVQAWFFSGFTFATAEVVFITSKIAFIFSNLFLLRQTIFEKLWPIETIKNKPKSSQTRRMITSFFVNSWDKLLWIRQYLVFIEILSIILNSFEFYLWPWLFTRPQCLMG